MLKITVTVMSTNSVSQWPRFRKRRPNTMTSSRPTSATRTRTSPTKRRFTHEKWGVSEERYPGNSYPPYVAGPSYMVPMPVVSALLQAVRRTEFLFLEDVYTTGLAAKKGGISHYNIFTLTNSLPNKIDVFWCSGARVFQENVGLKEATRGWNKIRELEGIIEPPEYVFTP
nr:beta-1,3-galactosyltransferase 1-like [Penaeus vannamei]